MGLLGLLPDGMTDLLFVKKPGSLRVFWPVLVVCHVSSFSFWLVTLWFLAQMR